MSGLEMIALGLILIGTGLVGWALLEMERDEAEDGGRVSEGWRMRHGPWSKAE